ncbi:MAG: EscU/YscU/HrcU family type III secretion system export apparatus switch protein [Aquisalinus sp.]|nr:EscU/YscU/HrcU family type III secretion system export apparatus switch protein [Aquisalinus sp.]
MAENQDTGDKTELPTPKKLKDLRKKGQVAKSKDVTSVIGLIAWVAIALLSMNFIYGQLAQIFGSSFAFVASPSKELIYAYTLAAFRPFIMMVLLISVPIVLIAIFSEVMQSGFILTTEKIKPKFDNLDIGKGLKRMFSMDNMVEIIKSLIKITILLTIGMILLYLFWEDLLLLIHTVPSGYAHFLQRIGVLFIGMTIIIFVLLAAGDALYQKFSFTKKNKMSMRDIRQELKDTEGDPLFKESRKETAREWAESDPVNAAANATALLVNPTHISLALKFNPDNMSVPIITAKGVDALAAKMKRAAISSGVPIIRDIKLARDMYGRVSPSEPIPPDLYRTVAEIIVWAQKVREQKKTQENGGSADRS